MAHIPHFNGKSNPIRSMKELGDVLLGLGYFIGFFSLLVFLIILYGKSYKDSSLLIIDGIMGAISLVLLVLGSIFRRKKQKSIFAARSNRRK